jgi:hypothetical protein
MPKTHPPYPAEYRRRMVEQLRAGRSLKELAREFEPSVEYTPLSHIASRMHILADQDAAVIRKRE